MLFRSAGAIVDLEGDATSFSIEASRRLGDHYTLALEMRSFVGLSEDDLLYAFRKDNYLQLELSRYW